jgi:hypothetical protein
VENGARKQIFCRRPLAIRLLLQAIGRSALFRGFFLIYLRCQKPLMNQLALRTIFLILHAVANFILITLAFNYDITGSWALFIGFIAVALLLLFLFIKHLLSYIYFIKTKTK